MFTPIATLFTSIACFLLAVIVIRLNTRLKALEAWQQDAADQHERTAASFRLDENDFDRQLL